MFNFIAAERDFFFIPFEDCAEGAWKVDFMVEIFIFYALFFCLIPTFSIPYYN